MECGYFEDPENIPDLPPWYFIVDTALEIKWPFEKIDELPDMYIQLMYEYKMLKNAMEGGL